MYCDPDKYPLVYLHSLGDSQILAALNPSRDDASCPCPYAMGQVIYAGGKAVSMDSGISIKDNILHIPGESAVFMELGGVKQEQRSAK